MKLETALALARQGVAPALGAALTGFLEEQLAHERGTDGSAADIHWDAVGRTASPEGRENA